MIRRWSRINTFNKSVFLKPQVFLLVSSNFNISFTRSANLKTSQFSFLYRTKWARRKHLVGWLFLTFILSFWSQEYYFYKILSNFFFTFKFYRFNFGLFNSLPLKYLSSSIDLSSQFLKLGFLRCSVRRFYKNYSQLSLQNSFILNKNFAYASAHKIVFNYDTKKLLNLWTTLGGVNQILKYNGLDNIPVLQHHENFYFVYLWIYLTLVTEHYKTFVYLMFNQIFHLV